MQTLLSKKTVRALQGLASLAKPLPRRKVGRPPKSGKAPTVLADYRTVVKTNADWSALKEQIKAAEKNFQNKKAAMQVAGIELQELKHKLHKLEDGLDA